MTEQARNFYGRIKGKALKPAQKRYLDEDLPALELHGVNREENPDRQTVDAKGFFAQPRPLWLEIGFGGGEHLVYQAKRNPEIGIIGCEPYLNGVAMALGKIKAAGVSNLRLYTWDVRDLFDVLPDACLERAFLLYPDPWPKVRHHRRRFVTPDHLLPFGAGDGARRDLARCDGYCRLCPPDHGRSAPSRVRLPVTGPRGMAYPMGRLGFDPV